MLFHSKIITGSITCWCTLAFGGGETRKNDVACKEKNSPIYLDSFFTPDNVILNKHGYVSILNVAIMSSILETYLLSFNLS